MIKDELCFVCVPFISKCSMRHKEPDYDLDYSVLNMMACDGVERAGFIPISPTHLWGTCFKYNYDKGQIIQAGFRLIELCECFYFCDCKYDESAHEEMEIWRIKAQMLNKRFISIDRKFLK